MNFKKLLLFLVAPLMLAFAGCEPTPEVQTFAECSVVDAEGNAVTTMAFGAELESATFTVTATRSWTITTSEEWIAVSPKDFVNADNSSQKKEITVSVFANEGEARTATLSIDYGDTKPLTITVSQSGKGQTVLGEEIYYDNFDKGTAQENSGWPALDGFVNPTGTAAEGVTYTVANVQARSNSPSNNSHSGYLDEASGGNNAFYRTNGVLTINNIDLSAQTSKDYTLTFGCYRSVYGEQDNSFKASEFHVFLSGDGQKWTEITYQRPADEVSSYGTWNKATASFTLKEKPAKLSIRFASDLASSHRLDDVKLTVGGGGAEIDLANGTAGGGGNNEPVNPGELAGSGEGTEASPYDVVRASDIINKGAATSAAVYTKGIISQIDEVSTSYGNATYYISNDGSKTGHLTVFRGKYLNNEKFTAADQIKVGDEVVVLGVLELYNGSKPEITGSYIFSHKPGDGSGTGGDTPSTPDTPVAGEGTYASDSPFVQSADDSTNAVYTLGATTIGGQSVTGFKLGKSKQQGKFTSKAVGVSGSKYLNFYAVAWKGTTATLYYRVDGGAAKSVELQANAGATGNPPYVSLAPTATDQYSVLLEGLTATSTIEFATNADFALTTHSGTSPDIAPRAIVFGVKLSDQPIEGEGGGSVTPDPEPEPDPTPGEVATITIPELYALADNTVVSQDYVLNVVVSGASQNSSFGTVYVMTKGSTAAGNGFTLYNSSLDGKYKVGDELKVTLPSGKAKKSSFNGVAQISEITADNIEVVSSGNTVNNITIPASELINYLGMPVTVENATIASNGVWCTASAHGSHNFTAGGTAFTAYVNKRATNFQDVPYYAATGSISGIAVTYKGNLQIAPRDAEDVKAFANNSGTTPNPEPEPEPEVGVTKTYVKVTSAPADWTGEYLIVYEEGSVAFDSSLEKLDAVGNNVAVTIADGKITTNSKYAFTVAAVEGGYSLKASNGQHIGASSYANGLKTDKEYVNTLSIDTDGNAVIGVVFSDGTVTMRYNYAKDQLRFRYYKSGQQPVALYKAE